MRLLFQMRILRLIIYSPRIVCGFRYQSTDIILPYRRLERLRAYKIGALQYRCISCSRIVFDKPADDVPSKVEQSLKLLREELQREKEQLKEKGESGSNGPRLVPKADMQIVSKTKWVWTKEKAIAFKDELVHYYNGFKLFFIELGITGRLIFRLVRGSTLSRRERKQLVRTTSDLFRMLPFSVFIIIPFMELALPLYLKFFPNALPSTFQSASKEAEKVRRQLKVKLEMAKFMQATLEQLSLEKTNKGEDDSSPLAKDFTNFMKKVREEGGYIANSELLKYSKLFEDELTIENLNYEMLRALCRIVGIVPVGTIPVLRFQLTLKIRALKADDMLIAQEGGVDSLTVNELQAANRARGMRALGLSEDKLKTNMKQWLELSLDDQVPPSLLLLSRTMLLSEEVSFTDRLKQLIGQLPDALDKETRVKVAEMQSGKIDNKARLELVQSIEAALSKERDIVKAAKVAEDKEKKAVEDAAQAIAKAKLAAEVLVEPKIVGDVSPMEDMAKPIVDTATELSEEVPLKPMASLSKDAMKVGYKEDLADLAQVLHNVQGELAEEKEDLQELKEQIEEHKEDVDSVKLMVASGGGEVKESKAARRLQARVDKIINNASKVLEKVHHTKEVMKEQEEEGEVKKERLVSINSLLLNLRRLQKMPDDTKLQKVQQILEALDEDHDGNVNVNMALQVIELLGTDNVKIDSKQMTNILSMLKKEEELQDLIDSEMLALKMKRIEEMPDIPDFTEDMPDLKKATTVISEYSDKIQPVAKQKKSNKVT